MNRLPQPGMPRKGWLAAAVAAAALAGLIPQGMAEAAPQAASYRKGLHCGGWHKFYGRGGYTYVEVRACLDVYKDTYKVVSQDPTKDIFLPTVQTRGSQYYKSASWHYAANYHEASWRASGTVRYSRGGQWKDLTTYEMQSSQSKPDGGSVGSEAGLPMPCGAPFQMTLDFHQTGPHWADLDYVIAPVTRTDKVSLPCA